MVKKIILLIILDLFFLSIIFSQQNFTISSFIPSLISNDHTSEGFMVTLSSGRIMHFFRLDPGQFGNHTGNTGMIVKRHSDDGGQTWSTPDSVYDDQYDDRNINGGILSNGRIVLTFRRYNANNAQHIDYDFIYSDDGGATWSQRQVINSIGMSSDCQKDLPYVPTVGYMLNVNQGNYIETRFSNDGINWSNQGYTWDYRVSHPYVVDETCFAYTRNGKIIGLIRNDTSAMGANYLQTASGNYGSSYSQLSHTNMARYFFCPSPLIFYDSNHDDLWAIATDRRGNITGYIHNDESVWIYNNNVDSIYQNPTNWTLVDSMLRPYPSFYRTYGYPSVTRRQDGNYLVVYTESYRGPYSERAIFYQFTITYNTSSVSNSSISCTPDSICPGSTGTLNIVNGCLSNGSNWFWYSGSCGGTPVGTGFNLPVSPTANTNYFVRAQGLSNTTTCLSALVLVNSNSVNPSTVTSSSQNLCTGASASLSISGGTLGTNAIWKWFSGACGTNYLGSGVSVIVSPSNTTTYFVKAVGSCNANSSCLSITITTYTSVLNSSYISAGSDSVCQGGMAALNISGLLPGGDYWNWYSGFCGGIFLNSDPWLYISPSSTSIYYAKPGNLCTSSASCLSVTIVVSSYSTNPASASSSPVFICPGSTATLNISGGILGTGAVWKWYTGSCGGISIASGSTVLVSPYPGSSPNTYYVRAEGACNSVTTCLSTTVVTYSNSLNSVSALASPPIVCPLSASTLSLSGGLSQTDVNWYWYTQYCGGAFVDSGNSIQVFPSSSSTYYVRAENFCNISTSCLTITVQIFSDPIDSTVISKNINTICPGDSSLLSLTFSGSFSGYSWAWYSGSCGNSFIGTGSNIKVSPSISSTYYASVTNYCSSTLPCLTTTITVGTNSSPPVYAASVPPLACPGTNVNLSVYGGNLGTGANWDWYTGVCDGTLIGSGTSINVILDTSISLSPYYVRAEGLCNTTSCISIVISFYNKSVNPSSANSTPSSVCPGGSSTLSLSGGALGIGDNWYWYEGSCGGALVGSGASVIVNPIIPSIYFVRAEGACKTATNCIITPVSIDTISISGASLYTISYSLCSASPDIIGMNGGMLGTGAGWYWYSGSCGGTLEGMSQFINISPTLTTMYYARAVGMCNTTNCLSINIEVTLFPNDPAGINASDTIIYLGQNSILSASDSLAQGVSVNWYENGCGNGVCISTSMNIIVFPLGTTTYYCRNENGNCYSNCKSITVIIPASLNNPGIIYASSYSVCSGQSSALSISGTLNGGNWYWYLSSCGGSLLGSGSSLTISSSLLPSRIFVRQEAAGSYSSCSSVLLNTDSYSTIPVIDTSGITILCIGSSSSLAIKAGTLGTGANWFWYSGSCGGTIAGVGQTLILSPSFTSNYFARAEGFCNTTNCSSRTIIVNSYSYPATSISASSPICPGSSANMSISGGSLGTNANWVWFSGFCNGAYLATGSSITISPSTTTTYFVHAEGICNTTVCLSKTIVVKSLSSSALSASSSTPVCPNTPDTLNLTGGSLGTGASWKWYSGSCGGTYLFSGTTHIASPSVTTTYYVMAAGDCNTTGCVSTTIQVYSVSLPAISLQAISAICPGSAFNPVINGGNLGTGANWNWYSGSCNSIYLISGISPSFYPTTTTIYYVSASGLCNTTSCVSITVIVNSFSLPPAAALCSSPVCYGTFTTLNVSGGNLGSSSNWYWYSGSCGGNYIRSGGSISIGPSSTNKYYVMAKGYCNTTACASTSVIVNTLSTPALSIMSFSSVCSGSAISLGIVGGSLGTGAKWNWYTGSCNGFFIGTGTSLIVSPTAVSRYYVSAAGLCNTTICISKTILINSSSAAATSIFCPSQVCAGSPVNPVIVGGSLGTNANWNWYWGYCNGYFIASGPSPVFYPYFSTTYYLSASGQCNTTSCISKTVIINTLSVPPVAISSYTQICEGFPVTLNLNGGQLGSGARWNWYSGICNGTLLMTGAAPVVTPSTTTTYYVCASGLCNTTTCISITITVSYPSVPPSSITGLSQICQGSSVTLGINGGNLGSGASWNWYSGSCYGAFIATSTNPVFSPSASTTYYVSASGMCGSASCISKTVIVSSISYPASSISCYPVICEGSYAYASVSGGFLGSGANWNWYTGSCNGNYFASGHSVTLFPSATTTYYVSATGLCNITSCINKTITVDSLTVPPVSLSGTTPVCQGNATTIGIIGGSLGAGSNWRWYTGYCNGSYLCSGVSAVLHPYYTTTYYLSSSGLCNSTSCQSITITVNSPSYPLSSISPVSPICSGSSVIPVINGGIIGSGANWNWYTGSCNGSYLISGISPVLSPVITTTYYASATGLCNSTSCVSFTITVNSLSSPPTSVSFLSPVCQGSSDLLQIMGGQTGASATWAWYSGSCGGTYEGNGSTLTVFPQVPTYYFVRAEGLCNSTSCFSFNIIVNVNSIVPDSIISDRQFICHEDSLSIEVAGGGTGSSGNWYWFSGSCGDISEGAGTVITVSPSSSTNYFVRAECTCNTSTCISIAISVSDSSNISDFYVPSPVSICYGDTTSLNVSGVLHDAGSNFYWFSSYCGGISEGIGTTIPVDPSNSTTYFVRYESQCNTTSCRTVEVIVNDLSVCSDSIIVSQNIICSGTTVYLNEGGGYLGTSGIWNWYTGDCGNGQDFVGSGNSISASPIESTYYFVRAEGSCNTTNCLSINLTVLDSSLSAVSAIATMSNICEGNSTTISITGGYLGTSAQWYWYLGSCGNIPAGTGAVLTVSPPVSEIYYARAEGQCNTTTCSSLNINVYNLSVSAISILASPSSICQGNFSTLDIYGGYSGAPSDWHWYSGNCGSNFEGSGISLIVSPTISTNYFVRAEGFCNTTGCTSLFVNVMSIPTLPMQLTGSLNPVFGSSQEYTVISDPATSSYIWSIPSTWTGSGSGNSIDLITGYSCGTISVTPVNSCGNGNSSTLFIQPLFNISGSFFYDQTNIPLDSVNVDLRLNGSIVDSTITDLNGSYLFHPVPAGIYTIKATTGKPWGGVNSTDALMVKKYFSGVENISSLLRLHAADVNLSSSINVTDAINIIRRFCGNDTSFRRGNWIFEKPLFAQVPVYNIASDTLIVLTNNVVQGFKGICVGDVNGSNVPLSGAKITPKVTIQVSGIERINPSDSLELPLISTKDMFAGAISLVLEFPKEVANVQNVRLKVNDELTNISYKVSGNELRIGWFEPDNSIQLFKNEPFIYIYLKFSNKFKPGDSFSVKVMNNSLSELADDFGNPVEDLVLNTYSIESANIDGFTDHEIYNTSNISIYPNPAKKLLYIKNALNDNIIIYNLIGEKVLDLISNSQLLLIDIPDFTDGTYLVKIVSNKSVTTRKVVIEK